MKKELNYLFNEEFLPRCRHIKKMSEVSIRGYKSAFELLVNLMPEVVYPEDLTPNILTKFFQKLNTRPRIVGRGKERIGIKKSTVATYWSKLNKFFRWLVDNEHMKKSPLSNDDYPTVEYDDRRYLKKSDVEKIFNSIDFVTKWKNNIIRKRNIVIFSILLYTGIRRGELLGLKNADIDFDNKNLIVRAETSKSKKERIIPLHPIPLAKIKDYMEEKRRINLDTVYLLASDNCKGGLSYNGIKHLVEKIRKESGVRFHLHQFRHTFAVNFLKKNNNIVYLQQLMGHKKISMTAKYLRCIPTEEMRNCVDSLTLDNLI